MNECWIELEKENENIVMADTDDRNALAEANLNSIKSRQYPAPPYCPPCDPSVYSYCSYKMIHDSCCCNFPGNLYFFIKRKPTKNKTKQNQTVQNPYFQFFPDLYPL